MRAHLRAFETIMPLSSLSESLGNPAIFQARIWTGSFKHDCKVVFGV